RCEDIDNHADTLADESLEARPAKTVEMNEASAQMRELIAPSLTARKWLDRCNCNGQEGFSRYNL
ncbi:MAG: hypothetical protein LBL63_02135, partial [Clostridiales Family XIII bacterium]|nr:hypothetical protein [Clostridiales Family XIII bacterium]